MWTLTASRWSKRASLPPPPPDFLSSSLMRLFHSNVFLCPFFLPPPFLPCWPPSHLSLPSTRLHPLSLTLNPARQPFPVSRGEWTTREARPRKWRSARLENRLDEFLFFVMPPSPKAEHVAARSTLSREGGEKCFPARACLLSVSSFSTLWGLLFGVTSYFPPPFPSLQTFQQPAMWLTCKHFVEVAIVK